MHNTTGSPDSQPSVEVRIFLGCFLALLTGLGVGVFCCLCKMKQNMEREKENHIKNRDSALNEYDSATNLQP